MSLPNKKGVTTIVKASCDSIGLTFQNDPDNEKLLEFSIATLVQQINQASGGTWNAALEAFAGLLQIRFLKRSSGACVVIGFDEAWFTSNLTKTIDDLVEFLRKNAVEVSE